MATQRLDLNLLHVFATIYREGSLTRASHVLHLTQPAVSHSLSRLRDHFGDPLFVRQGNQMIPTPVARRLADTVTPGLNQIQSAVNQFQRFEPGAHPRTFNLALRDVLEATVLPPLLQHLVRYPRIDLVSQRVARRDMEAQLAAGKIDLAVDVMLPVSDQTAHEPLSRDALVVVARRDHPLQASGMSLEGYLAQRHVLVSSRAEGPGLEDFELSRLGVARRIALRCQHYFAACRVAEQSDLLVTMPGNYAELLTRYLHTVVLPAPVEMPAVDVHLYWHAAHERDPALAWLRALVRRVAAINTPSNIQ